MLVYQRVPDTFRLQMDHKCKNLICSILRKEISLARTCIRCIPESPEEDSGSLHALTFSTLGRGLLHRVVEKGMLSKTRRSAGTLRLHNPELVQLWKRIMKVIKHLVSRHFVLDVSRDDYTLQMPKDCEELEHLYTPSAQPGSSPGPMHRALGHNTNGEARDAKSFAFIIDNLLKGTKSDINSSNEFVHIWLLIYIYIYIHLYIYICIYQKSLFL